MAVLIDLCSKETEKREEYDFEFIRSRAIDLAKTNNAYVFNLFDEEYKLIGVDFDSIPAVIVEGKDSRIVSAFIGNQKDKEIFIANAGKLGLDIEEQSDLMENESIIYVETDLNIVNIYTLIDLVKTVNLS